MPDSELKHVRTMFTDEELVAAPTYNEYVVPTGSVTRHPTGRPPGVLLAPSDRRPHPTRPHAAIAMRVWDNAGPRYQMALRMGVRTQTRGANERLEPMEWTSRSR